MACHRMLPLCFQFGLCFCQKWTHKNKKRSNHCSSWSCCKRWPLMLEDWDGCFPWRGTCNGCSCAAALCLGVVSTTSSGNAWWCHYTLFVDLVCWWKVKVIGNTLKLVFITVIMCIDACCYAITLPSCAIIVFCYLIMYIVVYCLLLCYSFQCHACLLLFIRFWHLNVIILCFFTWKENMIT